MAVQKITTGVISDDAITSDKLGDNLEISGTSHMKVPVGTTAQRPESPASGYLRFNTTLGKLEQYDGSDWSAIDSPPVVSSVSPSTELGSDDPQSIVITGSNFSSIVTAKVIGNDLTEYTPTTVTRNSSSQVTITFASGDRLTGTNEPYDVKVINSSGLSSVLEDAFNINDVPTWSTASGSLGTVYEDVAMSTVTVSATDPESVGITYSVQSGALPSGVSLNTSTGAITGTPNVNDSYNSSGVTHNFTLGASDGAQITTRSFSILRKWLDGSSSSTAPTTATAISNLGISTNGYYWIKPDNGTAKQMYVYFNMNSSNWVVIGRSVSNQTTYTNAPGFYNDGNSPGPSTNGSISLFDWSNTYVGNSTNFMWYDSVYGSRVKWLCANLTSIKAAPDTFSSSVDSFQLRLQGESNWNSSSSLHQFCRVHTTAYNTGAAPNFTYSTSTNDPWNLYGKNMYFDSTASNDHRGFSIANGSGYEGAYGKAGLQRYNPSPFYVGGNILTLMQL